MTEGTLIVGFDRGLDNETGMCVSRVVNGKTFVLNVMKKSGQKEVSE